jgi:rhodanese-related sulfurtransferase
MLKQSAKELVAEANRSIDTITAAEATRLASNARVLFVDVREPGELAKSGTVAGALHVPRGLLEFRADPESPMHQPELGGAERLLLYCGSGARSALAAKTLNDMGFDNVSHVAGGFPALKAACLPVVRGQMESTVS